MVKKRLLRNIIPFNAVPNNFFLTVRQKSNFTTNMLRVRICIAWIMMKYIFKALRIKKSEKKNMLTLHIKFPNAVRKPDSRKIQTVFLPKKMCVKSQNWIHHVNLCHKSTLGRKKRLYCQKRLIIRLTME